MVLNHVWDVQFSASTDGGEVYDQSSGFNGGLEDWLIDI